MSSWDSFYTELMQSSTLGRGLEFIFTKFASDKLEKAEQLSQFNKCLQLLFSLFPQESWSSAIQHVCYSNDQLYYLCQFLAQQDRSETALEILRNEASKTQNRPALILQNALYDLEKKQLKQDSPYELSTRLCPAPFETLLVSPDGSCRFCFWSVSLGNLKEQSLADIWHGEFAKKIRYEMLEGKFQFCNKNICYRFRQDVLPEKNERLESLLQQSKKSLEDHLEGRVLPYNFELSYDQSCPYNCPSCRSEIIGNNNQSLNQDELKNITDQFVQLFEQVHLRRVLMSGYGEFSTSPYMLSLLKTIDIKRHPDLKLHLLTSGNSSLKKVVEDLPHLKGHFKRVYVSFDTLNENTYKTIRSVSTLKDYLHNLQELAELKEKKIISELVLVCTIQESNYNEIPQLVQKTLDLNATEIRFKRLRQRGTFTQTDFEGRDICSPSHPKHKHLRELLRKELAQTTKINLIDLFFDIISPEEKN